MDEPDPQSIFFEIIAHAGEAKSFAMEALTLAKQGSFDEANASLKQSKDSFLQAHKIQTALIQKELNGEDVPANLILIHAEDHLMSSLLIQEMATEFIELYQILHTKGIVS